MKTTPQLLHRYLEDLSEIIHSHNLPDGTPVMRARAGKSTRSFFSKNISEYNKSIHVWDEFQHSSLEKIWVWSDQHINHNNIIKYTNRPFNNVIDMNETMLKNAIDKVSDDDWLLFGGDVCIYYSDYIKEWIHNCPGRKLLILGNHDKNIITKWREIGFEACAPCFYHTLSKERSKKSILWTHYPLSSDAIDNDFINIHGHIHEKTLDFPRINISVEQQNMSPINLNNILNKI